LVAQGFHCSPKRRNVLDNIAAIEHLNAIGDNAIDNE
jgi:hypothetical protein